MTSKFEPSVKGALGEWFIRNILETNDLEVQNGLEFQNPSGEIRSEIMKEVLPRINLLRNDSYMKEFNKEVKRRYGTESIPSFAMPDFKIKNKKVFVEVKTGKWAKLHSGQEEEFPKIVKKGFRIFIAKPFLEIKQNSVTLKKVVWEEFLSAKKTKKASLSDIKKVD